MDGTPSQPTAKQAIADADVIVVVGLSARKPDTEEIERYVAAVQPGTAAIHVGIRRTGAVDDSANQMGGLLRKVNCRYRFLDVMRGELPSLPSVMEELTVPRERSKSRVAAIREMCGPLFEVVASRLPRG